MFYIYVSKKTKKLTTILRDVTLKQNQSDDLKSFSDWLYKFDFWKTELCFLHGLL